MLKSGPSLITRTLQYRRGCGLKKSWGQRQARLQANLTLAPNHHNTPAMPIPEETSLPLFNKSKSVEFTQSPNPSWKLGQPNDSLAEPVVRKRWDMENVPSG